MPTYIPRYIHKISPSPSDTGEAVELDFPAFYKVHVDDGRREACRYLGQKLRVAGVLAAGCRVREYRFTRDLRVRDELAQPDDARKEHLVVFPTLPGCTTYWHSVILTPTEVTQ